MYGISKNESGNTGNEASGGAELQYGDVKKNSNEKAWQSKKARAK